MQTPELLNEAESELDKLYSTSIHKRQDVAEYEPPDPTENSDGLVLREVILGERPPLFLYDKDATLRDNVTIMASRLPFERKRALRALAALANVESEVVSDVQSRLKRQQAVDARDTRDDANIVRNFIDRAVRRSWFDEDAIAAVSTSYLLNREHRARANLPRYLQAIADHYTHQLGLKLQLALIAYRLDHGAYPQKLDELVPHYLPSIPIDPYSGEEFKYDPLGLKYRIATHSAETLPADNPCAWSVGAGNNRLVLDDFLIRVEDETIPFDPDTATYEKIYRFLPDDIYGRYGEALVFPLPPIQVPNSDE